MPFHASDQDALNIAAMYSVFPLSTLGPQGMGFVPRRCEDVSHGWPEAVARLVSIESACRKSAIERNEVLLDAGFFADTGIFSAVISGEADGMFSSRIDRARVFEAVGRGENCAAVAARHESGESEKNSRFRNRYLGSGGQPVVQDNS